jgi:eukaryotic-like serine/threonine-protein kinase
VAFDEMLRIIREEEPERPSTKLSNSGDRLPSISAQRKTEPRKLPGLVRGELDWIVMRALEKDRARRYESAAGFALDIQRHLADEPVQAGPPSAGYRLRKFVRRHRVGVFLTGFVAASVAAILFNAFVGQLHIRRERDRALAAEHAAQAERDEAEAARAQADRNLRQARAAVDEYLRKVVDNPDLKNRGDFHGLRKQLLAAALPFFEEFVRQRGDDPAVRDDLAYAHYRLGFLREEMGEHAAALRDFTAAREIYARLAARDPARPGYRQGLADSLNVLGRLHGTMGHAAQAEAAYRESVALLAALAARYPAVPTYRRNLAGGYNNLGLYFQDHGKPAEAEQAYRQSLALRERLVAEHPTDPAYRRDLADLHINLGNLWRQSERYAEAEPEYRQALALREKLAAEFPAEVEYRAALAGSRYGLGGMLLDSGRPAEAEGHLRQSLRLWEKLAADFPAVPRYRQDVIASAAGVGWALAALDRRAEAEGFLRRAIALGEKLVADVPTVPRYRLQLAGDYGRFGRVLQGRGEAAAALDWYAKSVALIEAILARDPRDRDARLFLSHAHLCRAEALDQLGRHAEAVVDWDRAIALADRPEKAALRLRRSLALAHAGTPAQAVAEAEDLTRGDTVAGETLSGAARVYALASAAVKADARQRQSYAAQAVALLRRAGAAGFFADRHEAEQLKADREFDALRPRADFAALLWDLADAPPR